MSKGQNWDVEVSDGHCEICGESTAVATVATITAGEDTSYTIDLCSPCLRRAIEAIELHKENNW